MRINMKGSSMNLAIILSILFLGCSSDKHDYESFSINLVQDGTVILSDEHIDAYIRSQHKILLNEQGITRWNSWIKYDSNQSPPIPVLSGGLYQKDFSVKLDDDIMYDGKFWSMVSSLSYNGIVILDAIIACDSVHNWITIENGYASQPSADLRENDNIFEFFDSKGKLQ